MTDRQRTVLITMLQYYPERPSGSARIAFDEATYLAEAGHKVWVLTQADSEGVPEYAFREGLHVLTYSRPRLGILDPRRAVAHQSRVVNLLRRYLQGGHVDLLHGHSLLQYDGARSHLRRGVRQCYSVHSPVYMEKRAEASDASWVGRMSLHAIGRGLHRVESRCIEAAHAVTAFSDYTRNLIGSVYGPAPEARTVVVPGWVDMRRFTIATDRNAFRNALGWPVDVPVLFTLRRLVPRMGLDRLLCALKLVESAGFRFHAVIAGDGRLRQNLEGLTRELGLGGCVSFPGRIPDGLLPMMYAAADAFVLPTAELECFGLIALESLACGRPVLATPIGAIPEVVGRFEPNWIARDATAGSLAEHLIRFLDGQLPRHEPQALRATVESQYSRETVVKRLVQVAFGE